MAEEDKKKGDEEDLGKLYLIKKRLYAKQEPEEVQKRGEELHRLGVTRRPARPLDVGSTLAGAKFKNLSLIRAKRWGKVLRFSGILALLLFIAIWAVVITVWYRSTQTVREADVALSVEAPIEFTAGEEIIYIVKYGNDSRVDWQNVELTFTPPRGFIYRGSNAEVELIGKKVLLVVGDLASEETGELHVRGQLIGEQNETAAANVELVLTPENFPSGRFTSEAVLATTITALPLEVSLNIPNDAASGERVLATMVVRNLSNHTLDNVYLRLFPATGIELAFDDADFSPGISRQSMEWEIAQLGSLEDGEFTVVFYVEGQPGEKRVLDIEAGLRQNGESFVQRELTHLVTVSATEVVVEQLYNGQESPLTVRAGERVSGEIRYKNIGTVGLKDAIVEVAFEGIGFDPSTLDLSAGSYDPVEKKISWSAATVPELAVIQPQQESSITYSFTIIPTDQFPTDAVNNKNHVIITTARVDSPDLPAPVGQAKQVISDRAVIAVRTDPLLEVDAFYDDGRLGLASSGPLPPEVGQTTSYTIRFRAGSTLNDLAGVTVSAVMPDGVKATSQTYKTAGDVFINDRTGQITWTLPFIDGLVGRLKPPEELHVQVQIRPGENTKGSSIDLLNQASLEGVDQFTEESVATSKVSLPTTGSAVPGQGNVQ